MAHPNRCTGEIRIKPRNS